MSNWAEDDSWIPLPPIHQRTVNAAMAAALHSSPEHVALVDETSRLTYSELHEDARQTAGGLAGLGVGHGSRVLTMLDNHADHVIVWLALSYLGAVSVPVNTAFLGSSLRHVVRDSEATVAVLEEKYADAVDGAESDHLQAIVVRGGSDGRAGSRVTRLPFDTLRQGTGVDPVDVAPWDLHSVMYTSGTTSAPKGVLVTQALTYTRGGTFKRRSEIGTAVLLTPLPLFHVVAQCTAVLAAFLLRGTAVVLPSFSASRFWDQCREHGATETVLMGAMASFLLNRPPTPQDCDHPLRRVSLVPCTPDVHDFAERFGVEVVAGFGMTEIGTISIGPGRPFSCGYVHQEYEYRLVDEFDVEVPPGGSGELVVRSTVPWTLTPGYLARPDLTVDLWRNLWIHTGDLFHAEPDGELIFEGRKKSVIRRRGENIAPATVEAEILTHPGVVDCVVVPVPGDDGEEEVMAVLTPSDQAAVTPEELLESLWGRLPYFMLPRYLLFLDEMPRTATHKVDMTAVAALADVAAAWDREAAGIRVTRAGISRADDGVAAS